MRKYINSYTNEELFSNGRQNPFSKIYSPSQWEYRLVIFPVRSCIDDKLIWPFTYAFKGVHWILGRHNGRRVFWMTSADYLIAKIKGEVR
jgi:hypothetical protein